MRWNPRDYQERAIKLLLGQAALGLFLDPGLGKTSTVLASFKILKDQGMVKKMLLIAPLRPAYSVWPQEIAKWDEFRGLTYTIVHGAKKEEALREDVDIYIINPEGLLWLLQPHSNRFRSDWDVLCIDESTRFKDSQSKRFKLLKPHIHRFSRRWILTGTPVPNTAVDLFSQTMILDQGSTLGKYITHFRNKFMWQPNPYQKYRWELKPGAFEDITGKIAPLVLQLNAEENLHMPDLINNYIYVKLPEEAREKYRDIEDDFITQIGEGVIVAANAAVASGKCRQIANGALYINAEHDWEEVHSEKIEALKSLVEELNGNPLLLLYEFQHDAHRIQNIFPDTPQIGGGISARKADAYIQQFNAGELPLLIGHPASMGHGLNLQGVCHHVCWFGIPWNFEHYDQAIRRVYRQGQKNKVFVHHLVAEKTLDETVIQVLAEKERTQDNLLRAISLYRQ